MSVLRPIIRPIVRSPITSVLGQVGTAFSPSTLFAASEVGGVYDPSDLSTLWQNAAGTTPVTADSDPVRRIDDKSGNGFHMIAPSDAARPLYKTSGGLHWLQPDGVDDWMVPGSACNLGETWSHVGGWLQSTNATYLFGTANVYQGAVRELAIGGGQSVPAMRNTADTGSVNLLSAGNITVAHVLTVEQSSATAAVGSLNAVRGSSVGIYSTAAATRGLALFSQQNNTFGAGFAGRFYGGTWIARALTASERSSLESFYATKAGVSL